MKIAILLALVATYTIPAFAAFPPVDGESHNYRASFTDQDTNLELRPLAQEIVQYTWAQGIYSRERA